MSADERQQQAAAQPLPASPSTSANLSVSSNSSGSLQNGRLAGNNACILEDGDATLLATPHSGADSSDEEHKPSAVEKEPFLKSRWVALWVVGAAFFLNTYIYSAAIPILPAIARTARGGTQVVDSDVGLLFACYAAGYLLATPIFGVLSDRMAERRVPLAIGLGFLAVSSAVFVALRAHFWPIAASRVAHGIASTATWAMGMALLTDVFPADEFAGATGIVYGCSAAGELAGFVVGGFLGHLVGTQWPFVLLAVASALTCVAALAIRPPHGRVHFVRVSPADALPASIMHNETSVSEPHLAAGVARAEYAERGGSEPVLRHRTRPARTVRHWRGDPGPAGDALGRRRRRPVDMLTLVLDARIAMTLAVEAVVTAADCVAEAFLPQWLENVWGLPPTVSSIVLVAGCLPQIALSPFFGWLVGRGHARPRTVMACGLVGVGLVLLILPHATMWLAHLVPLLAVLGACVAAALTPVCPVIAAEADAIGGGASYGQLFSAENVAYGCGMLLGPWLAGVLMARVGTYRGQALDDVADAFYALRGPFAARAAVLASHTGLAGVFAVFGALAMLYAPVYITGMAYYARPRRP